MKTTTPEEIIILAHRTNRLFANFLQKTTGFFSISTTQYFIMKELTESNGKHMEQYLINKQIKRSSSTIARALIELNARRLVSIEESDYDRRKNKITITNSGEQLFKECNRSLNEMFAKRFAILPKSFWTDFEKLNSELLKTSKY